MPIKHTIRKNGNNEFHEVTLTPARAIRKQCIECMGFAWSEIEGCLSPNCPLFPWRLGKTPVEYEIVNSTDLEPENDGIDAPYGDGLGEVRDKTTGKFVKQTSKEK